MRKDLVPIILSFVAGCATMSGGGGDIAPCPGEEVVKGRIKELSDKFEPVAKACPATKEDNEKGGLIEVTSDAKGQLSARVLWWNGNPATQACLVDGAKKIVLGPLPGPPVSTFWQIGPPPPPIPEQSDAFKSGMAALTSEDTGGESGTAAGAGDLSAAKRSCAQRHLPPDFGADVRIAFAVLPGGKAATVNVLSSNARDGGYEACLQQAIAGQKFPDPHYDGPYPLDLNLHIGPSGKL